MPRMNGKKIDTHTHTRVATSTYGGERNNSIGLVVGYVQQLLRADNKRTAARSVICHLSADTVYDIW